MKLIDRIFKKRILSIVIIAVALLGIYFISFYQSKKMDQKSEAKETSPSIPKDDPKFIMKVSGISGNHTLKQMMIENRLESDPFYQNYIIEYPASWSLQREQTMYGTKLIITRDGYELNISQAGSNVGSCTFKGELINDVYINGHKNEEYTQIRAAGHLYRRLANPNIKPDKTFMYYCELFAGGYEYPSIGTITYTAPKDYDSSILLEMDNMIRSIQIFQR